MKWGDASVLVLRSADDTIQCTEVDNNWFVVNGTVMGCCGGV